MARFAMGWRRPDNVAGSAAPAIMVGFFVATGGLLFGYDTGSINGILSMDSFLRQFSKENANLPPSTAPSSLEPKQQALIISMLSAGTTIGALLSAPIGDFAGRRKSLILSVGVFVFGVIFQIVSTNIPLLLVGRFFAGVGVGAVSVLVPLYQSEMAPKWIRGTLVCAYQLFITVGLLSASVVNLLTYKLGSAAAYRIPMGLQLTWACILSLGLLVLPETPRFLVKCGNKEMAALSLSRLRRLDITHPALIEELAEIVANHEYEMTLGNGTYRDIFLGSPHLGRRTLTGCALQILQQLTGVNFILYYSTTFFRLAGVKNPFMVSVIINVVNVVSTIPGMYVVESWGRRTLLMIGGAGMAVSQLLIASFASAAPANMEQASMQILVIFSAICMFFFAASWGPVAWVVTSEIYPLKVRAKSNSVSTASNWILNFGIAYGTPFMVGEGQGSAQMGARVFFIWGAFCIVAVLFVYLMVYETSKLSLEQIDELYEREPKAWHSKSFVPSWSFQQIREFGFADSGIPPPEEMAAGETLPPAGTAAAQPGQQPGQPPGPQQHHLQPHPPPHQPPLPSTAHSDAATTAISASTTTSTAMTLTPSMASSSATAAAAAPSDAESKMLSSMANVDFSY